MLLLFLLMMLLMLLLLLLLLLLTEAVSAEQAVRRQFNLLKCVLLNTSPTPTHPTHAYLL